MRVLITIIRNGKICFANVFVLFLSFLSFTANSDVPNLIPLPKQVVSLNTNFKWPENSALIIAEENAAMIQSGIAEIVSVIEKRGGTSPTIGKELNNESFKVVIGTIDGSKRVKELVEEYNIRLTVKDPGPQGYIIYFITEGGKNTVLLAGSDAQGALYACVTFTQMLRSKEGGILIEAANVRDWPDFRYRLIGNIRSEILRQKMAKAQTMDEYVQAACEHVDFCLRYKINGISLRYAPFFEGSYTANVGSISMTDRVALKRISKYAADRGIFLEMLSHTAIDVGQGGPVSEIKDLVFARNVGFSWSHDELITEQARICAQFAHDAGVGLYFVHAPDEWQPGRYGGFYRRSADCRNRWKDDERAKADAHVMNIFSNELEKLSPETKMCAVLIPYGASVTNLDDENKKDIVDYWSEVNTLLPEDMYICVRENQRKNVSVFKEIYNRLPVYFYIETLYYRGWQPFFTTTPRFHKTFYFEDPDDLIFIGNGGGGDYIDLSQVVNAHFSWNTDAPGSALYRRYKHDPIHDGTEPEEVAGKLVDAILTQFFGDKAGHLAGEAVRGDGSWKFTNDPVGTSAAAKKRLAGIESDIPGWESTTIQGLENITELMIKQAEGSKKGVENLMKIQEMLEKNEIVFDEWQKEHFYFMLGYFVAIRAVSPVKAASLKASDAINNNRYSEAKKIIESGYEALKEGRRLVQKTTLIYGTRDNWLWQNDEKIYEILEKEESELQKLKQRTL